MMAKFQLKKTSDGQFFFTLQADNGEKILTSETYKAKPAALNGIESVKTNAPDDERIERKVSKAGKPYFVLKARNNEVIGTSEEYSGESARENGIAAVRSAAPTAPTDEGAM
jgi:uncharacterized protein YegP (UPF0339 family)